MTSGKSCPLREIKIHTSKRLANDVVGMVKDKNTKKMNAIWLEVTGCSGNIISLLNSENPGLYDILTDIVNFTFNNTLMGSEGEFAFEKFLETLDTEFILLVDGRINKRKRTL